MSESPVRRLSASRTGEAGRTVASATGGLPALEQGAIALDQAGRDHRGGVLALDVGAAALAQRAPPIGVRQHRCEPLRQVTPAPPPNGPATRPGPEAAGDEHSPRLAHPRPPTAPNPD